MKTYSIKPDIKTSEISGKQRWLNDADLWAAFQQDNILAYETIFKQYSSVLYQYGRNLGAGHETTLDLIQDLFSNLWEKRSHLARVESVKAYLFKSFRRLVLKNLILQRKEIRSEQDNLFETGPENRMIENQELHNRKIRLSTAMKALSPRQREILYLRYFESLSYQEISISLKINPNTAYNQVSNALKILKQHLKEVIISLACILFIL